MRLAASHKNCHVQARDHAEATVRAMDLHAGDRVAVMYFERELRARVLEMRTNHSMVKARDGLMITPGCWL